ncbi:MAG: aquaporin [Rhodothermales bacterium]|nr:aquaporin [Rhodothermales bacterium]
MTRLNRNMHTLSHSTHRSAPRTRRGSEQLYDAGLSLRRHWPEYLMEAAGLGVFMVSACLFTALVEFPDWPVRQLVDSAIARRSIVGIAMGLTAVGIIYSPWGKQSGAHINPAVTLTFLRLSRVAPWDAAFYIAAQFLGALAGVLVSLLLIRDVLADPSINYVVTIPGGGRVAVAFGAEFAISFGLMYTVLVMTNRPSLSRLTGIGAGILVAAYIIVEGPLSGMSMNPARTFGSALPANVWTSFWLYLVAPTLAMLTAAEVYARVHRKRPVKCAKLHHDNTKRCIFCAYHGHGASRNRADATTTNSRDFADGSSNNQSQITHETSVSMQ